MTDGPISTENPSGNVIPFKPRDTAQSSASSEDTGLIRPVTHLGHPDKKSALRRGIQAVKDELKGIFTEETTSPSFDAFRGIAEKHPNGFINVMTTVKNAKRSDTTTATNNYAVFEGTKRVGLYIEEATLDTKEIEEEDFQRFVGRVALSALGNIDKLPGNNIAYTTPGGLTYELDVQKDRDRFENYRQRLKALCEDNATPSLKALEEKDRSSRFGHHPEAKVVLPSQEQLITDFREFKKFLSYYTPLRLDAITKEIATDLTTSHKDDKSDVGKKQIATIFTTQSSMPNLAQGKQIEARYIQTYRNKQGEPIYIDDLDQDKLARHIRSCVNAGLGTAADLFEIFSQTTVIYQETVMNDDEDYSDLRKASQIKHKLVQEGVDQYRYAGKSSFFPGFED